MRVFIIVLVLTFSFQSWIKADDIRDFQIEGISIGDSLLDYFDKSEIIEASRKLTPYNHKDVFMEQQIVSKKIKTYDAVKFSYLKKDSNYKLYGIAGIINFEYNFDSCIKTQKEVIESIKDLFPNIKKKDRGKIISVFDKSKKSYYIETYFEFKDGSMVRIYCENWSEKLTKKNGWTDALNVIINDVEFLNFLRENY